MTVLETIGSAIALVRQMSELSATAAKADLKLAAVNLTEQLVEIKQRVIDLEQDKQRLLAEVKRLSQPPAMQFRDSAYYAGDDGPFCPGCYDSQGKTIRLVTMSATFGPIGTYRCPVCKTVVE